jgi:hypothetical protein
MFSLFCYFIMFKIIGDSVISNIEVGVIAMLEIEINQ